ncbi:iron-sulfur cluster insertion protein ErpA [Myxococcota bacterium]|nr:iron-sulfur cluster insertion protein ErpA [Myxococcota bacterium]
MQTNTQPQAVSTAPNHVILGADEEPPLQLTPKAIEMVKEALVAEKLEGHGLRVYVQGGGCSGFQYGLDFDNAPRAGDFEMKFDGLTVYVDPISAMHLEGTTIDYVMGISGAGFKFNNPAAKSTCGCGSSFST